MRITKKYRLQSEMEHLKVGNESWFKEYLKSVLEDESKPSYQKADYIAYSIDQLSDQITYVSSEIKELQALKKRLSQAKELALELTASVLAEYGIDKLEGTKVSSITITPQKTKVIESLNILGERSLMELGYFQPVLDIKAIEKALETKLDQEILRHLQVETTKEITPARIKVNAKRSVNTTQADELLEIVEKQVA